MGGRDPRTTEQSLSSGCRHRPFSSVLARGPATQRARAVNVITPEHYSYVLNDLKLIGALALGMFAVILVLHFTLPS